MNKNYVRINEENVLATLENGDIKLVKNTENMGRILSEENVLEFITLEGKDVLDRIKDTKKEYDGKWPFLPYIVGASVFGLYLGSVNTLGIGNYILVTILSALSVVGSNALKNKYFKAKADDEIEKLQEELEFLAAKLEKEKKISDDLILNSKKVNKVDTKNIKKVSDDKNFELLNQLNMYRKVLENINYYIEVYDNGMLYNVLENSLDKKDIEKIEEYIKKKAKIQ